MASRTGDADSTEATICPACTRRTASLNTKRLSPRASCDALGGWSRGRFLESEANSTPDSIVISCEVPSAVGVVIRKLSRGAALSTLLLTTIRFDLKETKIGAAIPATSKQSTKTAANPPMRALFLPAAMRVTLIVEHEIYAGQQPDAKISKNKTSTEFSVEVRTIEIQFDRDVLATPRRPTQLPTCPLI